MVVSLPKFAHCERYFVLAEYFTRIIPDGTMLQHTWVPLEEAGQPVMAGAAVVIWAVVAMIQVENLASSYPDVNATHLEPGGLHVLKDA